MRPLNVTVHNVRGALDVRLHLRPFSALIGPNNAGKTTLLDAVRLFYGSLDWDDERDRPWDISTDDPSWVEIAYSVSEPEAASLTTHTHRVELSTADREAGITGLGLLDGDVLRVRRYFTDHGDYRAGEYYFVPPEGGDLARTGWDDSSVKLGQCVYVPTLTKWSDHASGAGPSPLGDILRLAFADPLIDVSLKTATNALKTVRELLGEGPVARLEDELDDALRPWGLSARVGVGELSGQFIAQHLIDLHLRQEGARRAPEAQGAGVQRVLIAALIQAAAQLRAQSAGSAFRWVLFEEPEAFLHPAQVTRLAQDLRRLTESGNTAVTITTHDPTMLAASETPPEGIARVQRDKGWIKATSPEPFAVEAALGTIHLRSTYAQASRSCFRNPPEVRRALEPTRVLYDLDARRAAAFFADQVIVVEGISDFVFFEWLARRGHLSRLGANVGVLDAGGKFELHRAVTTLSMFGIPHVVMWDEDAAMRQPGTNDYKQQLCQDNAALRALEAAVHDSGSAFVGAVRLAGTIERWLGIAEEKAGAWKAANIGAAMADGYADPASPLPGRVDALLTLLKDLFDGVDPAAHLSKPEFAGALISRRLPAPSVDISAAVAALPHSGCICTPTCVSP